MTQSNLWGIDLGGTKVEGVILKSAANPEVLFRDRLPTGNHFGYEHMLNQIGKLVDLMEKSAGYKAVSIGFGTPGILDPLTNTMKNCNSTSLNGKPLKDDLAKLLGTEIKIANDANCFALAETKMGAAKDLHPEPKVVFGIIMGTGVGGGIVIDGKVHHGLQGIGGEWGHNVLDPSGDTCYCGKNGCVEQVLSGPALEKYYTSVSGKQKSLKEIYDSYKSGTEVAATDTINRLTKFFGIALSVVVNILDPDVVVVGGGVGNIDEIYSEGVESLRQNIFNNRLDTLVLKPKLGDSAGVFGAAFL